MVNTSVVSRLFAVPSHFILIAMLAVVLAAFTWQGVGLFSVWQGKGIDSARLTIRSSTSNADSGIGLEQVAKLHLFGEKASTPVAEVPSTAAMPSTNLKLTLVGAMTNSDAAKASALIATDKQTSRFFVGDNVASGVVLQEVRADSVVLKRNGKLETLSFPRASESSASTIPIRGGVGLGGGFVRPSAPVQRPVLAPHPRPLNANPRANIRPGEGIHPRMGN